MKSLAQRFWSKAVKSSQGCWLWSACTLKFGHGRFSVNGKARIASRVAYELAIGRIPDGICVLHRCDTPACVNPDHLFLGTRSDNVRDMISKRRDRKAIGELHGQAKLFDDGARRIREAYLFGASRADLAAAYGVDPTCISNVVLRKWWRHAS